VIKLTDISKSYGDSKIPAVNKLTLSVESGEFLVLLGESGCGKTTTLKMINRLIEPTSGTLEVAGRDVAQVDPVQLRRSIGYVFQEIGLFPHMTIGENVGAVPRLLGWSREKTARRSDELLELVGLEPAEFRGRRPDELSGGQRQRVGVARALAASPDVMLMDEPFGALDPITRSGLQDEFRKLQHRLSLTVVMVTHDVMEALLMADRIAVMEAGQIVAIGTPRALLENPGHPYAESLLDTPKRQADVLEQMMRRDDTK
jgi:osmoprotectant transport system ATP-binding protein